MQLQSLGLILQRWIADMSGMQPAAHITSVELQPHLHVLQLQADAHVEALFTTRKRPRLGLRGALVHVVAPWVALVGALALIVWVSAALTPPEATWLLSAGFVASIGCIFAVQALSATASRYPMLEQLSVAGVGCAGAWLCLAAGHAYAATVFGAIGATALGWAIARNIARLMWIVPLGLFASMSDIHSVYFGFTREHVIGTSIGTGTTIVEPSQVIDPVAAHTPTAIDMLTVNLPSPGGAWMLGLVDILFAAILFAIVMRYGLGRIRTWIGLMAGVVVATTSPEGIPVIPLLTAGFLLAHPVSAWRALRYSLRQLAGWRRPTSNSAEAPLGTPR